MGGNNGQVMQVSILKMYKKMEYSFFKNYGLLSSGSRIIKCIEEKFVNLTTLLSLVKCYL